MEIQKFASPTVNCPNRDATERPAGNVDRWLQLVTKRPAEFTGKHTTSNCLTLPVVDFTVMYFPEGDVHTSLDIGPDHYFMGRRLWKKLFS